MNNAFSRLSSNDLRSIANGLQSGRIPLPSSSLQIGRIVSGELCTAVTQRLLELSAGGFCAEQVATLIDSIVLDREVVRTSHESEILRKLGKKETSKSG